MDENRLSSISKADSDEKVGEFWDTHDFTEFDTDIPDAEFEVLAWFPPSATIESAKRTIENSPAIHCWVLDGVGM